LLSAKQDAVAAKRFFVKALGRQNNPVPRVINSDGHSAYPPAIMRLKAEGALADNCRHRPVPYLNNVLEQDHRTIKRRVNASQHFRSFWAAWRTKSRLRGDSYNSQRPSLLERSGGEGRSAAPLHPRSFRGDELNYRLSTPHSARLQTCNTS
jgi:transposase-like protein